MPGTKTIVANWRHDRHDDRGRGGGVRLRGRRSLYDRVHRPACRQAREPVRGLEPVRQGVRERFGQIGDGVARGLRLRHDHGSNYLADDFQQEVAFFGIESSPSFVREPEGNGVAERFIRTLKENLLWVRSFDTIEELRLALLEFNKKQEIFTVFPTSGCQPEGGAAPAVSCVQGPRSCAPTGNVC